MADEKVEKNEIIHDNLIDRVFENAACDSEISFKKFKMVDPRWRSEI